MKPRSTPLLLVLLLLAGCGKPASPPAAQGATDSQPMGETPMGGMSMRGTTMIPGLRAYLDSADALRPSVIPEALAAHERRLAEALDAFGADMSGMGMTADAAWMGLTDSIRVDLAELPGLVGSSQAERFRAHLDRVRRLLELHERMMRM